MRKWDQRRHLWPTGPWTHHDSFRVFPSASASKHTFTHETQNKTFQHTSCLAWAVLAVNELTVRSVRGKKKKNMFFFLPLRQKYHTFHHKRRCFLYILTIEVAAGRGWACSTGLGQQGGLRSSAVLSGGRGNAAQHGWPSQFGFWREQEMERTPPPQSLLRVSWLSWRVCDVVSEGRDKAGAGGQWCPFFSFFCGSYESLLIGALRWSSPAVCRRHRLSGPSGSCCSSPCRWSRWASPSRWPGCSWSGGSPSAEEEAGDKDLNYDFNGFSLLYFFLKIQNWK